MIPNKERDKLKCIIDKKLSNKYEALDQDATPSKLEKTMDGCKSGLYFVFIDNVVTKGKQLIYIGMGRKSDKDWSIAKRLSQHRLASQKTAIYEYCPKLYGNQYLVKKLYYKYICCDDKTAKEISYYEHLCIGIYEPIANE